MAALPPNGAEFTMTTGNSKSTSPSAVATAAPSNATTLTSSYPFSSPPPPPPQQQQPPTSSFNKNISSFEDEMPGMTGPAQFNQTNEPPQQHNQGFNQYKQSNQFNHQSSQLPPSSHFNQSQQHQQHQQHQQQPPPLQPNPSLPLGNWQDALSNPQMSQRFQEWKIILLKGIRPWIEDFFNLQQISLPTQSSTTTDFLPMTSDASSQQPTGIAGTDPSIPLIIRKRLEHNVKYYKCNYLIISFIISLYTFIQNIILFGFIILLSIGWTISIGLPKLWNQEIGGMLVQRSHLLGAMLVVSILLVISNLNTLLWWAFLTAVTVFCHGSLHNIVHSSNGNDF